MSIDPMKISAFTQLLAQQSAGPKAGTKQPAFEQLLEVARQAGAPEFAGVQADAVLKLAQLQLLQGLFGTDDESGNQADLFASLRLDASVPAQTRPSQQVDRIYREMQPTLLEGPTSDRTEIERMIDQVATKVSLAPELIRSVVAAESNFQPDAISPVGAQGLMQLMPATAQDLGVKDCFDPEQNLLGGSRYLKQMLDKYDGDLDKALAAYNWGQGNVDRKGLEQMPQETRDYLARVKGLLADKV